MARDILKLITPKLFVTQPILITPGSADTILTELNLANRPVKPKLWKKYSKRMTDGKWLFAGNQLIFDTMRILRQGQHTLLAIHDSGVSQYMIIVTGVDPKAYGVMDTGKPRDTGDVLSMLGYKQVYALASAVKSVIFYYQHNRLQKYSQDRADNQDVEQWLELPFNQKLITSGIQWGYKIHGEKKGMFLAPSTWAFLYYVLAKVDREQAWEFLNLLAYGENISRTNLSPIYHAREKLQDLGPEHTKKIKHGGTAATELKIEYAFVAWNMWRNGQEVDRLRIRTTFTELTKPI